MRNSFQNYIVIDDDRTNNLICNLVISKFDKDAIIELCTEPEKALAYIKKIYSHDNCFRPTIIFLDINMPKMSGFEFLDEFLKFDAAIRECFNIYMLSSSTEDFQSKSKKYPIVKDFLSKPLTINHLKKIFKE